MKLFCRALSLLCALTLLLGGCRPVSETQTAAPTVPGSEGPSAPSQVIPMPTESAAVPTAVPEPSLTRLNFPRLDGSTSTVPLARAIASRLLGETGEQVSDLIRFSRTTESFRSLMSGQCDLLISAEPAASIWEEKEEAGFEWEMEPFAVDGLVFLVNKDNPVDSLTIDQIRKIYTGEITNWSQVGGDDLEIVAFQRNEEAGSQTAMLNLVMKDTPMMEAPTAWVAGSMGALIDAVASFDGTPAAIGYSVYYYANDMRMADGLKILAVEGVEPSAKSIRSREYPLLNNYYVLIRAGLEEDSPAKQVFRWILSEEGQKLVAGQGYVSVLDVQPDPGQEYQRSPESVWTLSELYCGGDPLRPSEEYGILLPYDGTYMMLSENWGYSFSDTLMGLANEKGEILTAPVYTSAYYYNGLLVLQRPTADREWGSDYPETTLVSPDGSWMKELGCVALSSLDMDGGYFWAAGYPDGTLTFLNREGEPAVTFRGEDMKRTLGSDFFDSHTWFSVNTGPMVTLFSGLCYLTWFDSEVAHFTYLVPETGEILEAPPEGYPETPAVSTKEPVTVNGYVIWPWDRLTDPVTGEVYYGTSREDGTRVLLDANYQPVWENYTGGSVVGGKVYELSLPDLEGSESPASCAWYDLNTGECMFRYYLSDNTI